MEIKIFNETGELSEYGFACGYIERVETTDLDKRLFKEHGVYHVQSLKNNTPEFNSKFDGNTSHQYIVWESFNKLTEARKFYNKIK